MTETAAPHLTIEDVDQSGCLELLLLHPEASYAALEGVFRVAMTTAIAEGRVDAASALRLLSGVCSLRLTPEDKTTVYRRMIDFSDGNGSMQLEHLGPTEVEILAQLVDRVSHPALRARLADLVWLREKRRGADFARAAVTGYCSLPVERESWLGERQRCWHRALQLARQIRWTEQIAVIERTMLDAFFGAADAVDHEPLGYLKPLRAERCGGGEQARVAAALSELGARCLASGRVFEAEAFFTAAADWFEWARMPDERALMQARTAESIGLQGVAGATAMVRHFWYTKAIAAYRLVGGRYRSALGVEAKIDALRHELAVAGHQSIGEMAALQLRRIDVTDQVRAAIEHIKGRPSYEALLAFCGLDTPWEQAEMDAIADQNLSHSVFDGLFDVGVMAGDGRQVDRRDASADRAARVAAEVRAVFCRHAGTMALAQILPALDQLKFEHRYTLDDFVALAQWSLIVPTDRAAMFGQGLYAGYCGDMVQAMHILMPQFEHVVRHVLKSADAFTTRHDEDGLDLEISLSSLVKRDEMTQQFGYGRTLAIRALMCDKAGPNLRNEVAHGLATQDLCESAHALYAWWLVLQLVVQTRDVALDAGEAGGAVRSVDPTPAER